MEDPGATRDVRKMPKEQEAGGKEVCRYQIKESDKEEVGGIVGRVIGCLLKQMGFLGGFGVGGIGLIEYFPDLQSCAWCCVECKDVH